MNEDKVKCPYCQIEMILVVEDDKEKSKPENKKESKYKCPTCGYECMVDNLFM